MNKHRALVLGATLLFPLLSGAQPPIQKFWALNSSCNPFVTTASNTRSIATNGVTYGQFSGDGTVSLQNDVSFNIGCRNASSNYSGIIQGNGRLTKIGTGTQTLSGANTFTGTITIDAGTLKVTSALGLGNAANVITVNNGATLDLSDYPVFGTGGTSVVVTSGGKNYQVQSFTTIGNSNFTYIVNNPIVVNAGGMVIYPTMQYLVVAGGGGGGTACAGGGGGGGGVLSGNFTTMIYNTNYTVVIGAGGIAGNPATNGGSSSLNGQVSIGGGRGGSADYGYTPNTGGSGGGGGVHYSGDEQGGALGTTGQGFAGGGACCGGYGSNSRAGGGGGATAAGSGGSGGSGGNGGAGFTSTITGTNIAYGGGGGGGTRGGTSGTGGNGGGGNGGLVAVGSAGINGLGGGGGGGAYNGTYQLGGNGGSGIVIIRHITP
jgi:hypothetical protein